jgi:signal transduction histidine kinase
MLDTDVETSETGFGLLGMYAAVRNLGCAVTVVPVVFAEMAERIEWVFLAYRLPREPSTPRIALWRRLRVLGVVQVSDGLVALPLDARMREQLEWLADEAVEAGGEATLWLATATSGAQERALATRMAAAVSEEYRAVMTAARGAGSGSAAQRRRTLARLRRELRRIAGRDYFPPRERELARGAVEELARLVEAAA